MLFSRMSEPVGCLDNRAAPRAILQIDRMEVGVKLTTHLLNGKSAGRAMRERRHDLERDIECVMTPAERQDLFSALGRYPDSTTNEMREMLDHELAREQFERRFGHLHMSVISVSR
jgi:hypothetical protein